MPYDHIAQNHLNEIQQWTYDIRHVSGRLNTVADALSRPARVPLGLAYTLPPPDNDAGDWDGPPTGHNISAAAEKGQSLLFTVDPKDLALDQETCPDVARHRAGQHVTGLNVSKVEFAPGVWLWADVSDGKKSRPIVPKKHREPLIKLFHCLSHPGQRETLKKVSARYYWPDIRKDVSNYVSNCHECLSCKPSKQITPPLDPRPAIQPRFQDLVVDIVGPLPVSEGMRYLLTVVDRASRWFDALPMPDATA